MVATNKAADKGYDYDHLLSRCAAYESRPSGELSAPIAHVRTYGCQQNVSDSERIKGMLAEMGFGHRNPNRPI